MCIFKVVFFTETKKEPLKKNNWSSFNFLIPFVVHIFSTSLCYYFAKSACKMCMQRVAFALPLTLSTPLTVAVYLIICQGSGGGLLDRINLVKDIMYWECAESLERGDFKWQLVIGIAIWWLSQCWIAVHVWFPENKRLAETEV